MTEEFFEKKGWEIGYEEAFPYEDYTEEDLIELERIYNESHKLEE
jgi:hypothetical protein